MIRHGIKRAVAGTPVKTFSLLRLNGDLTDLGANPYPGQWVTAYTEHYFDFPGKFDQSFRVGTADHAVYDFYNTGDVNTPGPDWTNGFTIEMWYHNRGIAYPAGKYAGIFLCQTFWLNHHSSGVSTTLRGIVYDIYGNQIYNGYPILIDNAWNHWAFEAYSDGRHRFYMNGVKQWEVAPGGSLRPPYLGRIGSRGPGPDSAVTQGVWDEVRVSSGARYGGANFTPPAAPFRID